MLVVPLIFPQHRDTGRDFDHLALDALGVGRGDDYGARIQLPVEDMFESSQTVAVNGCFARQVNADSAAQCLADFVFDGRRWDGSGNRASRSPEFYFYRVYSWLMIDGVVDILYYLRLFTDKFTTTTLQKPCTPLAIRKGHSDGAPLAVRKGHSDGTL